jgi:hypothetical protein
MFHTFGHDELHNPLIRIVGMTVLYIYTTVNVLYPNV